MKQRSTYLNVTKKLKFLIIYSTLIFKTNEKNYTKTI